jgi:hypothetical protein
MNHLHESTLSTELTSTLEFELNYLTWSRFGQLLVERSLEHVASDSWATERITLEPVLAHALTTLRDRAERAAVLDVGDDVGDDCLIHVSLQRGRIYVYAAARTLATVAVAKEWVRDRYPVVIPAEEKQAAVTFWSWSSRGPRPTTRSIDVPSWADVARNYPDRVAGALELLMSPCFRPEHGQLLLWHGAPGTGKTYALRALAWEWRSWCRVHYITDPETFFGENARYMLDVLLDDSDEDDDDRDDLWRLLILEDTGELLVADAKERTGQGLSRLLNVVDGLIGQGLRVLVLVTTNEVLRRLHPAVARPGRCAAIVEFVPFPEVEASAWLERRGIDDTPRASTLAKLYARAAGNEPAEPNPIGFSQ